MKHLGTSVHCADVFVWFGALPPWPLANSPRIFLDKNELSHGCGKRLAVERLWRTIGHKNGFSYLIGSI